jgi:prepilin-type N-terminal cleavage/methylation domain-containing protein
MVRKAFTLIELLVVIAIIAILAAILFPVFAQAKAAAKKTAQLSNTKQTATSFAIYTTDSDDVYPTAYRFTAGIGWRYNFNVSTPLGWMGPSFAQGATARMGEDASHWSNNIAPYTKNYGILAAPGAPEVQVYNYPTSGNPGQLAAPADSNLTMNGLLHTWPATAIAAPSQLPLMWEGRGNGNAIGASLTNPALICPQTGTSTCQYSPATSTGCSGVTSGWFGLYNTAWIYTGGMNFSFTDTSAKYRKVGGNLAPANTNYKVDPFTNYQPNGNPLDAWWDGCNIWLFRPDYNFQ